MKFCVFDAIMNYCISIRKREGREEWLNIVPEGRLEFLKRRDAKKRKKFVDLSMCTELIRFPSSVIDVHR